MLISRNFLPFRYEAHYALPLGHKKNQKLTEAEEAVISKKRSNKIQTYATFLHGKNEAEERHRKEKCMKMT